MAFRQQHIEGVGEVSIYKRRGVKHVRLTVASDGKVRVTIPYWAPYNVGADFVQQRAKWISQQLPIKELLTNGMRIGKAHRLIFMESLNVKTRSKVNANQVIVTLARGVSYDTDTAQAAATKAAVRVLKKEAATLLMQRLDYLAKKYSFNYTKLDIKQMKGRWGSCNSKQEIVLNCYLMQLPWKYIDYVLLHELTHTQHMAHDHAFWSKLESVFPDSKKTRKELRTYRPILAIAQ